MAHRSVSTQRWGSCQRPLATRPVRLHKGCERRRESDSQSMYPSMLCHCGALHPLTRNNGGMERWKEPCDVSGHSRRGLTLLATFSNTAHMERAKTRGSRGNKSQHNRARTEVLFCFRHREEVVHLNDIPEYFIDDLQRINYPACFHFPPHWCRILQLYFFVFKK